MDRDNNRVNILGYSKSRLEIFINAIVFLLLECAYEVFYVVMQLPSNWTNKDYLNVDRPIAVPIFLLAICFFLANLAIFGGDGRIEMMQEKYGTFGILARKLLMYLIIVFLSSIIPIFIIVTFFK